MVIDGTVDRLAELTQRYLLDNNASRIPRLSWRTMSRNSPRCSSTLHSARARTSPSNPGGHQRNIGDTFSPDDGGIRGRGLLDPAQANVDFSLFFTQPPVTCAAPIAGLRPGVLDGDQDIQLRHRATAFRSDLDAA
jgi:hypothetical protein